MYGLPVFTYGDGQPEDEIVAEPLRDWLRSLGLDPEGLANRAVVVPSLNGDGYELHVERYIVNQEGRLFYDPLYGWDERRLRADRLVIRVPEGSWPTGSAAEQWRTSTV